MYICMKRPILIKNLAQKTSKPPNGLSFNIFHYKQGVIHKPRGQLLGIFDPPLPFVVTFTKWLGLCYKMVIWLTPSPSTVHVIYGWHLTKFLVETQNDLTSFMICPLDGVASIFFGKGGKGGTSNTGLEDVTSWLDGIPTTLIDTDRHGSLTSTSSSSKVVSSEAVVVVASGNSNGSGGLGNQILSELLW